MQGAERLRIIGGLHAALPLLDVREPLAQLLEDFGLLGLKFSSAPARPLRRWALARRDTGYRQSQHHRSQQCISIHCNHPYPDRLAPSRTTFGTLDMMVGGLKPVVRIS